jgi:hypothetical protein
MKRSAVFYQHRKPVEFKLFLEEPIHLRLEHTQEKFATLRIVIWMVWLIVKEDLILRCMELKLVQFCIIVAIVEKPFDDKLMLLAYETPPSLVGSNRRVCVLHKKIETAIVDFDVPESVVQLDLRMQLQ